jgi:hypothetical protein
MDLRPLEVKPAGFVEFLKDEPKFIAPERWSPNIADVREDGTLKGYGFLGLLERKDNPIAFSSEISVGISPKEVGYDPEKHKGYKLLDSENGQYLSVPLMVPTLNKKEINYLLTTPEDQLDDSNPMMKLIRSKAVEFAKGRMEEGRPLFAEENESPKYGKPVGAMEKIAQDLKGYGIK